eukprot:TRINITY_DN7316_c0_g1_i1.p1 TRINITY_DN7316_c0_g1~~TRINITY_DN7316_c0_g1_i1.p1  ORF type:complete len:861 (+),score=127.25 TRINITY_DN7316_c0_g1_i1:809-3391(+)
MADSHYESGWEEWGTSEINFISTTQETGDVAVVYEFKHEYIRNCSQLGAGVPSVGVLSYLETLEKTRAPLTSLVISHAQLDLRQLVALVAAIRATNAPIANISLNFDSIKDEECCRSGLIPYVLGTSESVKTLELFGNAIGDLTCALFASTLQNSKLIRLKLGDNSISGAGAAAIAQGLKGNSTLMQLHLGSNKLEDNGILALAEALVGNSSITALGLRETQFGARGMEGLAYVLSHPDCRIDEMQLKRNAIGSTGAMCLAHAIRLNRSLRILELEATGLQPNDAVELANALQYNKTVQALNLNDNQVLDEGAEAIGELLLRNTAITTVGLRGNGVGEKGARVLAKALRTNAQLTGLDLGNNNLGAQGAVHLAGALRSNRFLISLDLHSNGIHLQGILSLASAMMKNETTKHLDVSSNFSRDRGAQEWAKVLTQNTTLTRLSLVDNEIRQAGGEALLSALMVNTSLRFFCFGGHSAQPPRANNIRSETRTLINQRVAENKSLWQQQNGEPTKAPKEVPSLGDLSFSPSPAAGHPTHQKRQPAPQPTLQPVTLSPAPTISIGDRPPQGHVQGTRPPANPHRVVTGPPPAKTRQVPYVAVRPPSGVSVEISCSAPPPAATTASPHGTYPLTSGYQSPTRNVNPLPSPGRLALPTSPLTSPNLNELPHWYVQQLQQVLLRHLTLQAAANKEQQQQQQQQQQPPQQQLTLLQQVQQLANLQQAQPAFNRNPTPLPTPGWTQQNLSTVAAALQNRHSGGGGGFDQEQAAHRDTPTPLRHVIARQDQLAMPTGLQTNASSQPHGFRPSPTLSASYPFSSPHPLLQVNPPTQQHDVPQPLDPLREVLRALADLPEMQEPAMSSQWLG